MEPYKYIQKISVRYCDSDFKDQLKVSSTLAYLEEVASASAEELGFGYTYIKPRGYAFMVSNIICDFVRPISLGERVCVGTWPLRPSHAIFRREYQITDDKGEVCVNASSRWCLVDMQSGKLLPSKVIDNQDYSTYNTAQLIESPQWKIPSFKLEEGEVRFTITIANSEYDHNMHVNNTKYADYCFNCFTLAELAERTLKRFCISYIKQCKEGETLCFYRKKQEDGSYLVQGFNENGEVVTQSLIVFA